MLTCICCLRFVDGAIVTARIEAANRTEDATVTYSGAVKRLPLTSEKANAIELKALFKSFARELKASFAEQEKEDRNVVIRELDETLEHLLKLGAAKRKPSIQAAPD